MCAQHLQHLDSNPDYTTTLSQPGLLVMDVDSTLIEEEVIDELGRCAGVGEQVADITARAMNGELDFEEALRARVALLKGLPLSVFDEVYANLHFTTGALQLIDTLHEHGWKVGVVSGGFSEIVGRLAAAADIDHFLANTLGVDLDSRTFTGTVTGTVVTKAVKLAMMKKWAEQDGVAVSQIVAVGDGANDLPMMHAAGTGIAFCAKPRVREQAPNVLDERNLMKVLDFLRH